MKLPNSLTGSSSRVDDSNPLRQNWHRWVPTWILMAYLGSFFVWPVLQDLRAIFFAPIGLFIGYSYWFMAWGWPKEIHIPLAILLVVTLFSLPWFSILASSCRATALCSLGVVVLLLMQFSGCRFQMHKGSWSHAAETQAQRACVMQPRVRRTLGIESPHISMSPNPNGVPLGSTVIESRASKVAISLREMSRAHGKLTIARNSDRKLAGEGHSRISTERDGYFASPDRCWHAFNNAVDTPESAGGSAHSRTLSRAFTSAFL